MLNRGNPKLTNWHTCAELARMYELLRDLDPHHVTIGAVQSSDLWSFSDGTGALSIDVSMVSATVSLPSGSHSSQFGDNDVDRARAST